MPEEPLGTPAQQPQRKRRRGLMKTARLRQRKGRMRSAGSSHRLHWGAVSSSWMSALKMEQGCSVVMGESCCAEEGGWCSEADLHCAPER